MSNTIKFSSRTQFLRGTTQEQIPPYKEVSITTTSELTSDNVQIVGTTHEVIAAGDVTDSARCEIENIHASATISVGGDSTGSFVLWFTIPAGEKAVLPRVGALASTYLKSSAVSTPVRVTLHKVS